MVSSRMDTNRFRLGLNQVVASECIPVLISVLLGLNELLSVSHPALFLQSPTVKKFTNCDLISLLSILYTKQSTNLHHVIRER
jgi:hypothetical protein